VKTLHAVLVAGIALPAFAQYSHPTPENWGPSNDGVRVSLSLDKLTYAVGEEIPLHIAAQVLSAKRPVYAVPDVPWGTFVVKWDFSRAFHLTIIDEHGLIIGNKYPSNIPFVIEGSSGPLLCPTPLEVGHVYALELSANRKQKTIPTQPGTYRLIVSWSPYAASEPGCDNSSGTSRSEEPQPFVTVSSVPITIHVIANP
jgi:hypothetical protein